MDLQKNEILPGALNLMVLTTLSTLGSLHGYQLSAEEEIGRRASDILVRFLTATEQNL